jgi:hypothetical protein
MTTPAKACPFCHQRDTEKRSDFSTALMVSLYYCRACNTYFESIKWGDEDTQLDVPDFLTESKQ